MRAPARALAPAVLTFAVLAASRPSAAPSAAPQAPAALPEGAPTAAPTVGVTASRVAVDLVVRDKKGRLVKDLKVEDFEVTEDGQRQLVESFTVVARGVEALPEPATTTLAAAPATASPAPEAPPVPTLETPDSPAVLALVFDRMSPGGRDMAHKAALANMREKVKPREKNMAGIGGL